MKNETEIPIQREEDIVAANIRRDNYSKIRDIQADEYNAAIAGRLLSCEKKQVKCENCGRELTADLVSRDILRCTDCV